MRILVVDDSQEILQLLSSFLSISGHDVVKANDGQEAMVKSEEVNGAFDFVITDYEMPRMNGFEFINAYRSRWLTTPFIIMSATQLDESFSKIWGVIGLLEKPFQLETIKKYLETKFDANFTDPS